MNTRQFARWQEWVNANGYSWFSTKLENIGDTQPLIDIRFTGPVQYSYGEFDRITVSVAAENETSKL